MSITSINYVVLMTVNSMATKNKSTSSSNVYALQTDMIMTDEDDNVNDEDS